MYEVFTKSGVCVEVVASILDEDDDMYRFYRLSLSGCRIQVAEFRKDSIEGWVKAA